MNMFCATCNLHFPDHLNFCRRCGQALVRSTAEAAIESLCCTRCGARVVRGENFCQQCGYRLNLKTQETVVGACYHCGTSWRSGWLFCKVCGLDRDQALLAPVSAPASGKGGKPALAAALDELPRVEKVHCQYCGVEAKPFSRFCEGCGRTLSARVTGDLTRGTGELKKSAADPLRTHFEPDQSDRADRAERADKADKADKADGVESAEAADGVLNPSYEDRAYEARPTQSEPPPVSSQRGAGRLDGSEQVRPARRAVGFDAGDQTERAEGRTARIPSAPPTKVNTSAPAILPSVAGSTEPRRSRPISTRLNSSAATTDSKKKPSQLATTQTLIFVGIALLAIGGITWWWLTRSKPVSGQPIVEKSAGATEAPSAPLTEAPNGLLGDRAAAAGTPEGMVYVPSGTFQMGRDNGDQYERPALYVVVEAFYIDRTEVTNEEYQRFVAATRHRSPAHWSSILKNGKFIDEKAKQPVVNVSWDDANAYAAWANKRLPTETEWEYAARGKDGRLYPWGNEWKKDVANAGRGRSGRILAVGGFDAGASPFGALDMCGNVWEWTAGNMVSYANKNKTLAPGKVIRGGAYDAPKERSTTSYRGVVPPDKTYDKTGFRCVRSVK